MHFLKKTLRVFANVPRRPAGLPLARVALSKQVLNRTFSGTESQLSVGGVWANRRNRRRSRFLGSKIGDNKKQTRASRPNANHFIFIFGLEVHGSELHPSGLPQPQWLRLGNA